MKKKFTKILGVGLTLALLCSLLLTAAPVSALTQATVAVAPDEISLPGKYTINFEVSKELVQNATITVRFPDDTVVPSGTYTIAGNMYTIAASPGWINGSWVTPGPFIDADISAVGNATDRTVIFTVLTAVATDQIGETATVRIEFLTGGTYEIVNPTNPGAYNLEVKTSQETTYVLSASYDIDAPVVGGFVYVYNPSDILMATFGGSAALTDSNAYHDDEGFTIMVGPGTYSLTAGDVTITGKGLTLKSADGAAATIINAATNGIIISGAGEDSVIDGFTIDDAAIGVQIDVDDAVVKNCVITDATTAGVQINIGGTDATVTDNVIEDCAIGVNFAAIAATDMLDVDITGNEITETSGTGGIVFGGGNQNIDVTGNTLIGNDNSGIYFANAGFLCTNILIEGNTISGNTDHGIEIAAATTAPTNLVIRENAILDNEADGMNITTWDADTDVVMFNNFSGNTSDNIQTLVAVPAASFNWWGSAVEDDITAEFSGVGTVTYAPWLGATWESEIIDSQVAMNASAIDAKDTCGVRVSGMEDTTGGAGHNADIISAAQYTANPEDAIADAIAFYDVFVALDTGITASEVTAKLKFYDAAIDEASTAYFWTGDFWSECSSQVARAGLVWVTVTEDSAPALDELEATPFVVVAGEAVTGLVAPVLTAPDIGAEDTPLKPTLAWGTVADAISYDFQLADNPHFVVPVVTRTGDSSLIVPFYAVLEELDYSTAYYWRVKAVSATDESAWGSGVFFTMAEAEEPAPEVWMCSEGLTFDSREALEAHLATAEAHQPVEPPEIIVETPDVIVPLPAETPITPAWIYVIIGVGAVLVIALIVLIVRTRRVA